MRSAIFWGVVAAVAASLSAVRTDAVLAVSKNAALKRPVLVDLLRGGVYDFSRGMVRGDEVEYNDLPQTYYKLIFTEREPIECHPLPIQWNDKIGGWAMMARSTGNSGTRDC